jgi:hypothetical protein
MWDKPLFHRRRGTARRGISQTISVKKSKSWRCSQVETNVVTAFSRAMPRLIATVFSAVILLLAGCSSFEREWKSAPATARWSGRWTSSRHLINGKPAGGELRAVLSAPRDGKVDAHFRARWLAFTSDYRVTLAAQPRHGGMDLAGSANIPGFGGGLYRYGARLRGDHLTACYDSEYDAGTFDLHRALDGR